MGKYWRVRVDIFRVQKQDLKPFDRSNDESTQFSVGQN